jgi:anti-sigma factor RsiW
MNKQAEQVSDHDLHAYVDSELSEQRRVAVEAWLACHPEAAARVRDYQSLQERLHARFDAVLAEPAEWPVDIGRDRGPVFARAAGFAVLMLVSGLLGWALKGWSGSASSSPALADLVQPAAFAHQVYSTDTRYPVEIPALEQASLNRWLSRRMHTELRAPDLSAQSLQFIGGRLLPSTNRMAAQFMYEDDLGQRLTVYVRRITAQQGFSDFQYREQGDLHMFYWIDKAMGYAVIGGQPAARLIDVANAVHAAMETTTGRE